MYALLIVVLIIVAFLLIGSVLLQAGTGGGLAAMGGGAATESFLGGRQATTILTKASWWLGAIFLGIALILAAMSSARSVPRSVLDGQAPTVPAPVGAPPAQLPLDLEEGGQPPAQPEPGRN